MESPSLVPQCPSASAMGRRTVEETSEESSDETVELTLGVKTSKPKVCKSGLFDSPAPPRCLSPATAAAQTQMPSTKPKASAPVACRRLSDGSEAASLGDQSPAPSVTLKGTVSLASADPRRTFSVHVSITGYASVSAAQRHEAQRLNGKSNITREGSKSQYYRELCLQVEEREQQMERERRRNTVDDQKHNDTMRHAVWGMPGSGAPNYHLGTARRTGSLLAAGILPQEQIRDKGFSGIPFRRL